MRRSSDKDYTFPLWLIIVLLFLLLCGSCTAMTPAERERQQERLAIDLENWEMCELAYSQSHQPTWHYGHTHARPLKGLALREAVRSDLVTNRCRWVLGDHWADYM